MKYPFVTVGLGGGQLLAELLELSVVETALDGGVDAVQVERERRAGTGENDDEDRGDAEGDLLAARLLAYSRLIYNLCTNYNKKIVLKTVNITLSS